MQLGGALVLSIAGVGGVGKSTLVRQLLRLHTEGIVIWIDEQDGIDSHVALAGRIAERLAAALGPDSHSAHALAQGALFADTRLLTDALVHDVNAADGQQLVLVLDTYEALRGVAGPWLLEGLLGRDAEPIRGDLRLIVSGREPIQHTDRRWFSDWNELIVNIDLEPFSLAETQAYLESRPGRASVSVDAARAAYRTTGGLPVWLSLIGNATRADGIANPRATDVQYVVDRLLMWWDDPRCHRWVRMAWIPHWFNLDLLRVLLPEDSDAAFDWLTHQSALVHGEGGRWTFHDTVRKALRQEAHQRAPGELAEAHQRLADYWARFDQNQTAAFHSVYHRLLGTEPQRAVRTVSGQYVRALSQAPATAYKIAEAARLAREDADGGEAWDAIRAIEAHYRAWMASDTAGADSACERLIALGVLDADDRALLLAEHVRVAANAAPAAPATRSRFGWPLLRGRGRDTRVEAARLVAYGDALRLSGQYEAALAALSQALKLNPKDAAGWASRGETYRSLGQPHAAVQDLSRALRSRPDWAWARAARAAAHLADNAPRNAIADATRVLEVNPCDAWALAVRGLARRLVAGAPTDEAVVDLRQALHLDPSLTWAQTALEQWTAEASGRGAWA
jgi:tetratricopeptide (TPR) repeat protein